MPHDRTHKLFFLSLLCFTALMLAGFTAEEPAAAPILALSSDSMLKLIGGGIVALLAEIWRNQRALFKITNLHGESLNELKGFCEGRNGNCRK